MEGKSSSPNPIRGLVSLENVELEPAFGGDALMSCFAPLRCAFFGSYGLAEV
jgi:hypothetical protein